MPKKASAGGGESTNPKTRGNNRKAEAAAEKEAEKARQNAEAEADKWSKGAKSNKKNEDAAAKAAEAARKKAEKAALLAEEEASLPSKPKAAGAKTAQKKNKGIDSAFSALDAPATTKEGALNATGIDNALDALSLTSNTNDTIDRRPEKRYPAAYKKFEEEELEKMKEDTSLRRNQKIVLIKKNFDKHPDNPFNQVSGKYNSTKEQLREIAASEKTKTEARLMSP